MTPECEATKLPKDHSLTQKNGGSGSHWGQLWPHANIHKSKSKYACAAAAYVYRTTWRDFT